MPQPFSMNVTLTIRPERREVFLDALREVLPHARGEEACVYLNVGQSLEDPNVFINSEAWRDLDEYRDEILNKEYFRRYLEISEAAYAVPRVVVLLSPIEPAAGELDA